MWVGRRGERYVLKDLARVVHGRHEGNENREKEIEDMLRTWIVRERNSGRLSTETYRSLRDA